MPVRILLTCPSASHARSGNRVTALRWSRILRSLGHRVRIATEYRNQRVDALVALHARKSAESVRRFRAHHPELPVVVALTGTDLYSDLGRSKAAHRSLELAQRLVLLQPAGIQRLPKVQRSKARLIYQSVAAPRRMAPQSRRYFDVCVLAHLRAVKDPFRAAMATRKLADHSRIRILQLGAALTESYAERARAEQEHNPRYLWLGDLPRHVARARLAHSHLMVLSSKMEGGANVIGEAAVAGVPILASRIEGSVGLLGPAHPGFFEVGDTEALRSLLLRSETEPDYYRELKRASRAIAPLFRPEREKRAWRELIREISGRGAGT